MTYPEVLANARECIGKYCKACPVCNGVACKNQIPGPGAKGVGDTAIRNYNKWAEIRVNMDTLCEGGTPDTHVELFGKSFKYPFFAGPVGAVNLHYSEAYTDMTYNDVLVRACAENGIAAFTGDGTNPTVMEMATKAIGAAGGCGVPTIKPWNIDTIKGKDGAGQGQRLLCRGHGRGRRRSALPEEHDPSCRQQERGRACRDRQAGRAALYRQGRYDGQRCTKGKGKPVLLPLWYPTTAAVCWTSALPLPRCCPRSQQPSRAPA